MTFNPTQLESIVDWCASCLDLAEAADSTLVSYLVPSRPGLWIPGPGWLEWPVRIGPNMRQSLKK